MYIKPTSYHAFLSLCNIVSMLMFMTTMLIALFRGIMWGDVSWMATIIIVTGVYLWSHEQISIMEATDAKVLWRLNTETVEAYDTIEKNEAEIKDLQSRLMVQDETAKTFEDQKKALNEQLYKKDLRMEILEKMWHDAEDKAGGPK